MENKEKILEIKTVIFTIKNKNKRIYPLVKKHLELYNPEIKLVENYFIES